MVAQPTISIVELPKPPRRAEDDVRWRKLAERFRTLRLRSLEIAPKAFASPYEAESQRGLDQTFDRLSNPKARQFVAIENENSGQNNELRQGDVDNVCEHRWVGMVVLLGQMHDKVTAQTDPLRSVVSREAGDSQSLETKSERQKTLQAEFVLNGVFVEPSARGTGVGKALIDTALEQARRVDDATSTATCVIVLVNAENEQARKLYEKSGFAVEGKEMYIQEPRALLGEVQRAEAVALKMRLDLK